MAVYSPENSPEENLEIMGAGHPGDLLVQGFVGEVAVQALAVTDYGKTTDRIVDQRDSALYVQTEGLSREANAGETERYCAMEEVPGRNIHVVSNGKQTLDAIGRLSSNWSFKAATAEQTYKTDADHTSRLTGFTDMSASDHPSLGISVIRKLPLQRPLPVHELYTNRLEDAERYLELESGVGHAVQTNKGGVPGRPAIFDELPFRLPIRDTAEGTAKLLWDHLSPDYRKVIVAKTISPNGEVDISYIDNTHPPRLSLH